MTFFIKIENFEGTNSGLGHTLLQCEKYLKEKFIFLACDCMFTESIPDCDTNWLGYSLLNSNNSEYRTLEIIGKKKDKVRYIGRKASSTTATGNLNKHLAQQKEILEKVLANKN